MFANSHSSHSLRQPNKKFFVLFFLCCTLPFIAAKLALEFSWFTAGVTNKGELLEKNIHIFPAIPTPQHWHLVYVQAGKCNSSCELALYTLQQIYIGFGREQQHLILSIVADEAPSQLLRYPSVHWQSSSAQVSELQGHIVIVNQKGLVILRYPVVQDREHMLSVGKDIRTDLRRLIAYDRGEL